MLHEWERDAVEDLLHWSIEPLPAEARSQDGVTLDHPRPRPLQRVVIELLELFDIIVAKFGEPTLKPLRKMSDKDAEAFLLSLPGVGKKVARCVLMYSLGRQVFPVDTHCWRIARRLGWVRPTQKDKHCAPRDMDRLQSKIPPELRYSLHVNMISLGREFCSQAAPRCDECPISAWCPKIGVPQIGKK